MPAIGSIQARIFLDPRDGLEILASAEAGGIDVPQTF
jgi:hypothetical protein